MIFNRHFLPTQLFGARISCKTRQFSICLWMNLSRSYNIESFSWMKRIYATVRKKYEMCRCCRHSLAALSLDISMENFSVVYIYSTFNLIFWYAATVTIWTLCCHRHWKLLFISKFCVFSVHSRPFELLLFNFEHYTLWKQLYTTETVRAIHFPPDFRQGKKIINEELKSESVKNQSCKSSNRQ